MFVKDEEIIDQYVRLTPFLAHVLGQGCEVVVHDLTKPGHTLAAVYNSPAARTVGDPRSQAAQDLLTRAAGRLGKGHGRIAGQKGQRLFPAAAFGR